MVTRSPPHWSSMVYCTNYSHIRHTVRCGCGKLGNRWLGPWGAAQVMCFFYIFSDVAGDGMTIELSKLEPPETRGYILTTGQIHGANATARSIQ